MQSTLNIGLQLLNLRKPNSRLAQGLAAPYGKFFLVAYKFIT